MKKYKFALVEDMVKAWDTYDDLPTGNEKLDKIYWEQIDIIGHTNPYYRLFYYLVQKLEPKFVVELGAWRAYASLHMAAARPTTTVVTVDIHKDAEQKLDKQITIENANQQPNLYYINKWSWDAVNDVMSHGEKIDILFIDAWHTYEYAMLEWELYKPYLSSGALVICDDIHADFDRMPEFWDSMPRPKIESEHIHPGSKMGFFKYGR